ncbi:MAG TPA: methyltransferase [Rhizobiaceae bacterium]|nr:methyltransferase [Rhizobiaceae bacterium]
MSADAQTVDAFHRGAFFVVQPPHGHRSGMDAMILAAAVPSPFAGRLADLGAGAGAGGLAVAARCPGSRVVLIERDAAMASYARRTLELAANASLKDRASVLEADVSLVGRARVAAGMADGAFDFAIMNPPFNHAHDRPTPDALKRDAHLMPKGLLETWLRTAAAIVKPGGGIALIARPTSLEELLASLKGRFGGIEIMPVLPRATEPAIRIVMRAKHGSRRALSLLPPLVLHGPTGHGPAPHAEAVYNGLASLFGD